MIAIQKNAEPDGLTRLRERTVTAGLSPDAAYKKLKNPLKSEVRNSLVTEQSGLCAYCMCRIPRIGVDPHITPIIIDHMTARNLATGLNTGQGLDYNNFVATCNGNKASRGKRTFADLTCDAHKGDIEFRKVNPCKQETLVSILYTLEGGIDAADQDVKSDLIDTLNLNCHSSPLIGERKSALDNLIADIGIADEGDLLQYCTDILESFYTETPPRTPYVGILIWYLNTMIEALANT